jgi:hypothetical protein
VKPRKRRRLDTAVRISTASDFDECSAQIKTPIWIGSNDNDSLYVLEQNMRSAIRGCLFHSRDELSPTRGGIQTSALRKKEIL